MTSFDLMRSLGGVDAKYIWKTDVFYKSGPTWRVVMKKSAKIVAAAAAFVLLIGVFLFMAATQDRLGIAGNKTSEMASEKNPPLRVLMDFDFRDGTESSEEGGGGAFLTVITEFCEKYGGPTDIEIEWLPGTGAERNTAIRRIATEIMAGGGPDLFLCTTQLGVDWFSTEEAFLKIPEKNAAMGQFLPLDDLIANAQYMDWDKQLSQIMAGGRTEQGQMFIPLTYTFPMTIWRAEDVSLSGPMTWEEQRTSDDLVLAASSGGQSITTGGRGGFQIYFSTTFSQIADYENEQLAFTEEELLQRLKNALEVCRRDREGEFDSLPEHYQYGLYPGFHDDYDVYQNVKNYGEHMNLYGDMTSADEITILPVYNDAGGVTASITAYAAINANTKRAEDAFFLIDFILRANNQRAQGGYSGDWGTFLRSLCNNNAFMPHEDLGRQTMDIDLWSSETHRWSLNDQQFQALHDVREQITTTQVHNCLVTALDRLYNRAETKLYQSGMEDEEWESWLVEQVHDCYSYLQRSLQE